MRNSLLLVLPLTISLAAQDKATELWHTDYAKAKTLAAQEKKDLLLDFTGSDWCGWCIKLREEVFDTEEFKTAIAKDWVLVELDYPQKKKLPTELALQNQELQAKFAIEGYPTIMLCDSKGLPFGQTGYQPGGPAKYLEHLGDLRKKREARDAEFAKAGGKKGVERAKALAAALDTLEAAHRAHYTEVMDEILTLDADGKAGLKDKIVKDKAKIVLAGKIRELQSAVFGHLGKSESKEAMKLVEDFVAAEKPEGENRQQVLMLKANVHMAGRDLKAAIATLKEAHDAAPESQMAPMLQNALKNLEKRLANEPKPETEKKDGDKPAGKPAEGEGKKKG